MGKHRGKEKQRGKTDEEIASGRLRIKIKQKKGTHANRPDVVGVVVLFYFVIGKGRGGRRGRDKRGERGLRWGRGSCSGMGIIVLFAGLCVQEVIKRTSSLPVRLDGTRDRRHGMAWLAHRQKKGNNPPPPFLFFPTHVGRMWLT